MTRNTYLVMFIVVALLQVAASFVGVLYRGEIIFIVVFAGIAAFHVALFAYAGRRIARYLISVTVSLVLSSDFFIGSIQYRDVEGHSPSIYLVLALIYFLGSMILFEILSAIAAKLSRERHESTGND